METIVIVIGIVMVAVFLWTFRARRLHPNVRRRLEGLIAHTESIDDAASRVLEADKVLHQALKERGGTGSMGECLRRFGPKLPQEQLVWEAHKLRNRLAHEPGMTITQKQADRATHVLLQAAKHLIAHG